MYKLRELSMETTEYAHWTKRKIEKCAQNHELCGGIVKLCEGYFLRVMRRMSKTSVGTKLKSKAKRFLMSPV